LDEFIGALLFLAAMRAGNTRSYAIHARFSPEHRSETRGARVCSPSDMRYGRRLVEARREMICKLFVENENK
jgi:hypothetical protein